MIFTIALEILRTCMYYAARTLEISGLSLDSIVYSIHIIVCMLCIDYGVQLILTCVTKLLKWSNFDVFTPYNHLESCFPLSNSPAITVYYICNIVYRYPWKLEIVAWTIWWYGLCYVLQKYFLYEKIDFFDYIFTIIIVTGLSLDSFEGIAYMILTRH